MMTPAMSCLPRNHLDTPVVGDKTVGAFQISVFHPCAVQVRHALCGIREKPVLHSGGHLLALYIVVKDLSWQASSIRKRESAVGAVVL